jgi:predicted Rossmann fold nucleotide-binding protein DprA/Smf involved in DNA uptake
MWMAATHSYYNRILQRLAAFFAGQDAEIKSVLWYYPPKKISLSMINLPLFDTSQLKLSCDEKRIYGCLSKEPLHIEQIITNTRLTAGNINAGLVSLRLKGLIKQLPGNLFRKG